MATPCHWLIAYDVANPRRLQRLHYRLRKRALFVQESVAVLRASKKDLDILLATLIEHIDPRRDDLRVYRVDWPDGAWLSGPDARGRLLMIANQAPPAPARSAATPRRTPLHRFIIRSKD